MKQSKRVPRRIRPSPAALSVAFVLLAAAPLAAQQPTQPTDWAKLPRMQLDRQFAGPLQDTIIQRWHDPVDGTVCYIYLPITAAHTPPTPSGYVQYGGNTIGTISCTATGSAPAQKGNAQQQAVPAPKAR